MREREERDGGCSKVDVERETKSRRKSALGGARLGGERMRSEGEQRASRRAEQNRRAIHEVERQEERQERQRTATPRRQRIEVEEGRARHKKENEERARRWRNDQMR
jgi:hypothetical protein